MKCQSGWFQTVLSENGESRFPDFPRACSHSQARQYVLLMLKGLFMRGALALAPKQFIQLVLNKIHLHNSFVTMPTHLEQFQKGDVQARPGWQTAH